VWLAAVLSPIATWILGAFTLRILWGWFAYPTYHLQVPSLAVAMGLMLVPSLFTTRAYAAYLIQRINEGAEEDDDVQRLLLTDVLAIFLVLLTLSFGWVVHLFV
jgi:hypothetical protein